MDKKDLTKELLASCFKELIMTVPFDKITIKMITDRAGLIRPTFYKHFQDKYEILEWIFKTEITDNADRMIESHMEFEALLFLCRCLEKDSKFYRRCYQMADSPNSFENILKRYIYQTFLGLADRYSVNTGQGGPALSVEVISLYYTSGLIAVIREWINKDVECTADELSQAYLYLFSHSILDLVPKNP